MSSVVLLGFQKMTEKCFKKCVTKPGASLDSSEQVENIREIYITYNFFRRL